MPTRITVDICPYHVLFAGIHTTVNALPRHTLTTFSSYLIPTYSIVACLYQPFAARRPFSVVSFPTNAGGAKKDISTQSSSMPLLRVSSPLSAFWRAVTKGIPPSTKVLRTHYLGHREVKMNDGTSGISFHSPPSFKIDLQFSGPRFSGVNVAIEEWRASTTCRVDEGPRVGENAGMQEDENEMKRGTFRY